MMQSARELSVGAVTEGAVDDAARRTEVLEHLDRCAGCRRALLAEDPLWAFRRLPASSHLSAAGPDPSSFERHAATIDSEDLKQRVRGAIRARAMEESQKTPTRSTRRLDLAGLAAAVVVVLLAGGLQGRRAIAPSAPVDEGRLQVVDFLEAMPMIDASESAVAGTTASVTPSSRPARPSASDESPQIDESTVEVLAQMTGTSADVVWLVDESLEI